MCVRADMSFTETFNVDVFWYFSTEQFINPERPRNGTSMGRELGGERKQT